MRRAKRKDSPAMGRRYALFFIVVLFLIIFAVAALSINVNVVQNPSFENAISGSDWNYTESDAGNVIAGNRVTAWKSDGTYSYLINVSGTPGAVGRYGKIMQPLNLTGIGNITFDVNLSSGSTACQYVEAKVYIDNQIANVTAANRSNWVSSICSGTSGVTLNQWINTSGITGVHNLSMELYINLSANLGLRAVLFDNVRAMKTNNPPSQSTPILNSTFGTNLSIENLTCYNQSTADSENDAVKSIYNWYINRTSVTELNMPFEGGSNSTFAKDYSGFSNNGLVLGAVWNSTGGYDGKGAYMFDGGVLNQSINISDSVSLNITTAITIAAWVKASSNATDMKILAKQQNTSGGYKLSIYPNGTGGVFRAEMEVRNASSTPCLNRDVAGGTNIIPGVWYYVVGVYDNSSRRIATYVNGQPDRLANTSNTACLNSTAPPFTASAIPVVIARESFNAAPLGYFNGTIDDVVIYNYALSAAQVTSLYQNKTNMVLSQDLAVMQNWTCNVTPNDGYQDGATLVSNSLLIRENTPPVVLNITPLAGTNYTNGTAINITANVTDNYALDKVFANITWDSTSLLLQMSNSSSIYNLTFANTTAGGLYNVTIIANDSFNNINNTVKTNFTILVSDAVKPVVGLNLPANGFNSSSRNITFNWTATDNFDTNLSCNLTINNTVNASNIASLNNTATNYSALNFIDGTFYWNVTCIDDASNVNTSLTRNFTVDATPPSMSAVLPAVNSTFRINDTVEIAANVTDSRGIGGVYANVTFPNGSISAVALALATGSKYNATFANLAQEGIYNVTIISNDTLGNTNATSTYFNRIVFFQNTSFDIVDQNNNSINYTQTVLQNNSGLIDVQINFTNQTIMTMTVYSFNDTQPYSLIRIARNTTDYYRFSNTFGADLSGAQFLVANITLNATGNTLYKCQNFTFGNITCNDGSYEFVQYLTPGQLYTFSVNSTDPGFGDSSPDTGTPDTGGYVSFANGYSGTSNTYTSTQVNDDVTFGVRQVNGIGANLDLNAYLNLSYNLTNLTSIGANASKIINLTFVMEHCFVTDNFGAVTCGVAAGGTIEAQAPIEMYNWTLGAYVLVGNYTGSSTSQGNATVAVTSGFSDFINRTTNFTNIRYKVNVTITVNGNDAAFGADYTPLTVTYDITKPAVLLNSTINGFNSSSRNITFNWTATDNFDTNLSCNLSIDNAVNASNISSLNYTLANFTVLNIYDGTHLWNVTCFDDVFNTNTSETRNFTIDSTKPSVALNYPPSGIATSNTSFNFNWTATDNIDTNLSCNLSIDGSVNASNVSSLNNTAANFSVSGFADGFHSWNVTCIDDFSNFNISETRNFTVDTVKPSVSLNFPANGFATNINSINFNWTATNSIATVLSCNLSIDGSVNVSAVSSPNNTATNYSVSGFADGLHLWNVTCNESAGNFNTSLTRNFTVDATKPGIQFVAPSDASGAFVSRNYIQANVTATDDNLLNITLRFYNSVGSLANTQNSTTSPLFYNLTSLGEQIYYFNATAYDLAGNINSTETRNVTIDITRPLIQFAGPTEISGTTVSRSNIIVNVTMSDTNLINATIRIYDSAGALVNSSNSSASPLFSNFTGMANGFYFFNATAYDKATNTNSTLTRNVTLDTVYPYVNLSLPANGLITANSSINFNWTAFDNLAANMSCNLSIDGLVNVSNVQSLNNTPKNYTVASIADGFHLWNVSCSDNAGNFNTSLTRNFTVDVTAPSVTLNAPAPGMFTNINTINFNWTATNGQDTNLSCNLSINNVVNATNVSSLNNTATNYSVSNFADGFFLWNVTCIDDFSNFNTSLTRNFTVDTVKPSVNLNYPPAGIISINTSYNFNWTATNGLATVLSCNLSIDGAVNASGVSSLNNTATNYSVSNFADGFHLWNVTCNESAGNFNTSVTYNFSVNTGAPLWSNLSANASTVYWNQSVLFSVVWNNSQLAGYIFSTNLSGSWVNTSFIPFGGITNVSENISVITANAGSVVGWYFWANDTGGTFNQTPVQNFTVQSRPTSVVLSLNQSVYPQGLESGYGYDVYIPFQARYADTLTNNPIGGANCYVTNDETDDNVNLTYNATTGNYTGQIDTAWLYDIVSFNASCSRNNYNAAVSNTTTNVWTYLYLWNWYNLSYDDNKSDTNWLRKNPAEGTLINITNESSLIIGANLIRSFYLYATGTNGSMGRDFEIYNYHTIRMNVSVNDTSCQPYLCTVITDYDSSPLIQQCGIPQAILADTPTLLEQNIAGNYTLRQNQYLGLYLYLNCSSAVAEKTVIYYNYSGEPASIEAIKGVPSRINANVIKRIQLEPNYTIGPNSAQNVTRKVWISFNNTGNSPVYQPYHHLPAILAGNPDSAVPGTIYVYNSTENLWASDNASAGAPNNVTLFSSTNIIYWATEIIQNNSVVNETLQRREQNAIRDNETLIVNNSNQKEWNITVSTIYTSLVTIENVTVWTNYSAYGVPAGFKFEVNVTNSSGTFDITNQSVINEIITFPQISLGTATYLVTATDITHPSITFIAPTPNSSAIQNWNYTIINASATNNVAVDYCLLEWNGTNESMAKVGTGTNVSCWVNKTNILDGLYFYRVYANDSAGLWNFSETRNITIDTIKPSVEFVSPTDVSGISVGRPYVQANASVIDANFANVTIFLFNSTGSMINESFSNSTALLANFTGLADGLYFFNATAYDLAGNLNATETRNITIDTTIFVVTIESPLNQTYYSPSVWFNVTLNNNGAWCAYSLDGAPNLNMSNDSGTHFYSLNTNVTEGNHNASFYCNDTIGNSASAFGEFAVNIPPVVFIESPQGESYGDDGLVAIVVNATDAEGINSSQAFVTFPDSSVENLTLQKGFENDNFDSDTIGSNWFIEADQLGPLQNCTIDINSTIPGKAYISLSGDGSPVTDTYCSLVSTKPVVGDFDINISFEILNSTGTDTALNFVLAETPLYATAKKMELMALANWSGYQREYEIYVDDDNISEYLIFNETNETFKMTSDSFGKFRIKREGNNFTFFTFNNSDGQWIEEKISQNSFDFNKALYIIINAESAYPNYGSLEISWDDLGVQDNNFSFAMFNQTSLIGTYNVSIISTDNLGAVNSTEKTNFTIMFINDPPSVPFILAPYPGAVIRGTYNVTWSPVIDEENDRVLFNITLMNPDHSSPISVDSYYGNSNTTSYPLNTLLYLEGEYSMILTVFENETPELLSTSYTIEGNFSIDNTEPAIAVQSPVDGSNYTATPIELNYTASDPHIASCWYTNVTGQDIALANCSNASFTALQGSNNITFYANDTANNINSSTIFFFVDSLGPEISGITVTKTNDTATINWTTSEPANSTLSYGTDLSLSSSISNSSLVAAHSILFAGLENNTLYYYNITSCDALGNCNTTGVYNFTTSTNPDTIGPTFTNLANQTIPDNETFVYDIDATDPSGVSCFSVNDTANFNIGCNGLLTNATGLSIGTYWLDITVNDTLNNNNSGIIFVNVTNSTIPDVNPPVISSVSSGSVTNETAQISWATDESSNSTVTYGTTTALGSFAYNNSFAASHGVLLTSLQPNTTYYYNVTSCDIYNNCNTSGVYNFTTLPNVADTTGPVFTNLVNLTVLNNQSLAYDIDATDASGISCFSVNDTTNFKINCSGYLENKTGLSIRTYWLTIKVNDTLNNNNSGIIFVNATNSTIPDTTPPVISGANATSITNQSAIIVWNSDEPANSTINYGTTAALGTLKYNGSFILPHSATLSPLLPNTTYYYNITSCDNKGNCNTSGVYNFTTNINAPDTTPPKTVTGLGEIDRTNVSILWQWTNPSNPDFNHVEVWLNGTFLQNVSVNYYNATGLLPNTTYRIETRTADNLGNINTTWVNDTARTLANAVDSVLPVISNLTINPRDPAAGNFTFINASATDNVNISGIFANITLPNGTIVLVPLEANYSPPVPGRYNVTIFANDTSGNIAKISSYFIAGNAPYLVQFNVVNNLFAGIPVNLSIYFDNTNDTVHNHTFVGNITDLHTDILYDLLFRLYTNQISVRLNRVNLSIDQNKTLGVDKAAASGFLVTYGIFANYTFSSAVLIINYSSSGYSDENYLEVYRCSNWNFTGRNCSSSWTIVSASQDKARNTFTITGASFSAYSIKQAAVPSQPAKKHGTGTSVDVPPYIVKNVTANITLPENVTVVNITPPQEAPPEETKPAHLFGVTLEGRKAINCLLIFIIIIIVIAVLLWLLRRRVKKLWFIIIKKRKKGEKEQRRLIYRTVQAAEQHPVRITSRQLFQAPETLKASMPSRKKGLSFKIGLFFALIFKKVLRKEKKIARIVSAEEKIWAERIARQMKLRELAEMAKIEKIVIASKLMYDIDRAKEFEGRIAEKSKTISERIWLALAGFFFIVEKKERKLVRQISAEERMLIEKSRLPQMAAKVREQEKILASKLFYELDRAREAERGAAIKAEGVLAKIWRFLFGFMLKARKKEKQMARQARVYEKAIAAGLVAGEKQVQQKIMSSKLFGEIEKAKELEKAAGMKSRRLLASIWAFFAGLFSSIGAEEKYVAAKIKAEEHLIAGKVIAEEKILAAKIAAEKEKLSDLKARADTEEIIMVSKIAAQMGFGRAAAEAKLHEGIDNLKGYERLILSKITEKLERLKELEKIWASKLTREFENLKGHERVYANELSAAAIRKAGLFSRIWAALRNALSSLFKSAKKEEKALARTAISEEKMVSSNITKSIERLKKYERSLASRLSESRKRLEHYEKLIASGIRSEIRKLGKYEGRVAEELMSRLEELKKKESAFASRLAEQMDLAKAQQGMLASKLYGKARAYEKSAAKEIKKDYRKARKTVVSAYSGLAKYFVSVILLVALILLFRDSPVVGNAVSFMNATGAGLGIVKILIAVLSAGILFFFARHFAYQIGRRDEKVKVDARGKRIPEKVKGVQAPKIKARAPERRMAAARIVERKVELVKSETDANRQKMLDELKEAYK